MLSLTHIGAAAGHLRRTGVWAVVRRRNGRPTFCCCLGGGVMAWVDEARPIPRGRFRTLTVADRETAATCLLDHEWGAVDTFVADDWMLDGVGFSGRLPKGFLKAAEAILDGRETPSMAAGRAVLSGWAEATARRPAYLFGVHVGAEDACSPRFLLPLYLNAAGVPMSPQEDHETLFGVSADAEGEVDPRSLAEAVMLTTPCRGGDEVFVDLDWGFRFAAEQLRVSMAERGLPACDLVDVEVKAAVYV